MATAHTNTSILISFCMANVVSNGTSKPVYFALNLFGVRFGLKLDIFVAECPLLH